MPKPFFDHTRGKFFVVFIDTLSLDTKGFKAFFWFLACNTVYKNKKCTLASTPAVTGFFVVADIQNNFGTVWRKRRG